MILIISKIYPIYHFTLIYDQFSVTRTRSSIFQAPAGLIYAFHWSNLRKNQPSLLLLAKNKCLGTREVQTQWDWSLLSIELFLQFRTAPNNWLVVIAAVISNNKHFFIHSPFLWILSVCQRNLQIEVLEDQTGTTKIFQTGEYGLCFSVFESLLLSFYKV